MWPMVPWSVALLTAHSSATHSRDQVSAISGHSRESGITKCSGAEMSIAAQGSAPDPHSLRSALPPLILRRDLQSVQKHLRNESWHQGGKRCKHSTPGAPQIARASSGHCTNRLRRTCFQSRAALLFSPSLKRWVAQLRGQGRRHVPRGDVAVARNTGRREVLLN